MSISFSWIKGLTGLVRLSKGYQTDTTQIALNLAESKRPTWQTPTRWGLPNDGLCLACVRLVSVKLGLGK